MPHCISKIHVIQLEQWVLFFEEARSGTDKTLFQN